MEQRILRGQQQTASSYSVSWMVNGGRRLLVAKVAGAAPTSLQPVPPSPGRGGLQALSLDIVIIMVVVLFALICAAYLNSRMRCMMRRRMQGRNARALFIGRADQDSEQGLDAKTLASLPVLTFKAGESSKVSKQPTALECTICLSEFTEDERLRLLPKCSHVFHLDCIDMWLLSHVSCPVCRFAIETVTSLAENGDESPDSGDVMLLVRDSEGNASVRRSTGVRITEGGVPGLSGRGLAENLDVRAELTRDRSWNSLSEADRMSSSRRLTMGSREGSWNSLIEADRISSSRRLTMGSREGSMSRNSFRAAVNSILTSSENVFSGRKSSTAVPRMPSDTAAPSLQLAGPTTSSPNESTSLDANDQLRDRSSSPPPPITSK